MLERCLRHNKDASTDTECDDCTDFACGPMASVGAIILIVVFLISGRWKENKAL